jgi:hypothetical protein
LLFGFTSLSRAVFKIEFRNTFVLASALALALAYGTYGLLNQVAVREKNYRQIASRGILQNTSTGISQVFFGVKSFGALGLIVGELFGRLIAIVTLLPSLFRLVDQARESGESESKRIYGESSAVSYINLTALFLDLLISSSMILTTSYWFSVAVSGQVSLAAKFLSVPITVVGAAFSQFILAESSDARRSGVILN